SQFYKVTYGRAGLFKLEGMVRSQPNVTAGSARSIWSGVGANALTLKPGLAPAASTPTEAAAVPATTPEEVLGVVRDKQGAGFSYLFSRETSAYVNASHEARSGARPFGGPFFFAFAAPGAGGVYETPRPIDDSTATVAGGVRHVGR